MAARGIYPTHTYMHTFAGATGAAVVAVLMGVFLLPLMARVWNGFVGPSGCEGEHWLRMGERPSRRALWFSALFGAWSHVFLDALHHPHSFPLWPVTMENPLVVSTMVDSHLVAIGLCVLGFGAIVLAGCRRRRRQPAGAPAPAAE